MFAFHHLGSPPPLLFSLRVRAAYLSEWDEKEASLAEEVAQAEFNKRRNEELELENETLQAANAKLREVCPCAVCVRMGVRCMYCCFRAICLVVS